MTPVAPASSVSGGLTRRASQAAGAVAVAIAVAALVGRRAGLPLVSTWGDDLPATAAMAALCLVALGIALVIGNRRLATATGVTVAAIAAVSSALSALGVHAGFEWLMLDARAAVAGGPFAGPGRFVQTGTVALGLAGAALGLSGFGRHRLAAAAIACLSAAVVVFALFGGLPPVDTLYGPFPATAPPLPAAAGLLAVAAAIVLQSGGRALATPRPLWHFLAVLGCLIVLPLMVIGAYAEVSIDAHLHKVRRDLVNRARTLLADIDGDIFGEIERLHALAASSSLARVDDDAAGFEREARATLALWRTGSIVLVDRGVRVVAGTGGLQGVSLRETLGSGPVERALIRGRPQVTGLFTAPATAEAMFAIVVPVAIERENRYALVRSVSQRALSDLIAAENLPAGWQAVISDAGGHRILARTGVTGESEGIGTAPPQWADARLGDVVDFVDSGGRPYLAGYVGSELTGWQAAVREPKALFETGVLALWRTLVWLAALSVVLAMAPTVWLGRIISRSVARATSAASGAAAGSAAAVGLTPLAEVNVLLAQLREAAARRDASEELVRDRERELRLITDNVPVAIARCNADGRFTFANREFLERYGVAGDQVIGRTIREVKGDALFAALEPSLARCLAGIAVDVELEIMNPGGRRMFVHDRYVPEWRAGRIAGLISTSIDITHLKEAERRVKLSEAGFRQLVDHAPFGIYVADQSLRVVLVSAGAQQQFHLAGRNLDVALREYWSEPFATEAIGHFVHTLQTGESYHAPVGRRYPRASGGVIESFDWRLERLTMPDGSFGVVCYFYNLAEGIDFEQALAEREARFRAMFDSSAVGQLELDLPSGRLLRVNAAMAKLLGYDESDLVGRSVIDDLTHPSDRERDGAAVRAMFEGRLAVFDREKRYLRKDGSMVWVRATANVVRTGSDRPVRSIAVVQDLGEQKRAEQDLRAGRRRLQLALDAARLGWFQYDPARRAAEGDARFREIFDLDADDTPFDEVLQRVHADDGARLETALAALGSEEGPPSGLEFRVQRRNGEARWVEFHGFLNVEGPETANVIGTVQDITERKEHEERAQLLMREINHRSKNMLSVVDAIAHQTAARTPEDFLERFSQRIQALSANQDLLVSNDWKGVGIAELVRAQMAHFADLIGSRIVVGGVSLRLNAASAQAIGLAVHELSTNAGKYGALSTDSGGVDICWSLEGDTFRMNWTENGGPPVPVPTRRGFGTMIMVMAQRTVGGKVALDFGASGVTWSLTCPATNVLERQEQRRQDQL